MVAPRLEQGKGHSGSHRHEALHVAQAITAAIRVVKLRARGRAGAAFACDVGRATWPSP